MGKKNRNGETQGESYTGRFAGLVPKRPLGLRSEKPPSLLTKLHDLYQSSEQSFQELPGGRIVSPATSAQIRKIIAQKEAEGFSK